MPTDRTPLDKIFDRNVDTDVYWDIETSSQCKLKDCGAHNYAVDPSTSVLVVCYAVGQGEVQVVEARRSGTGAVCRSGQVQVHFRQLDV
jgi:hypothetical protein